MQPVSSYIQSCDFRRNLYSGTCIARFRAAIRRFGAPCPCYLCVFPLFEPLFMMKKRSDIVLYITIPVSLFQVSDHIMLVYVFFKQCALNLRFAADP